MQYPTADFYEPLEFGWSEVQYEADLVLRGFIEGKRLAPAAEGEAPEQVHNAGGEVAQGCGPGGSCG